MSLAEERRGRLELRREHVARLALVEVSGRPVALHARHAELARRPSSATAGTTMATSASDTTGMAVRRSRHPRARTHSIAAAHERDHEERRGRSTPTHETTSASGLSDWLTPTRPHGNPPYGHRPGGGLAHDPEAGDEQRQPDEPHPPRRRARAAPSGRPG